MTIVEISAYLRDDASSGEIRALESQVAGYDEVQDVTYVSKQQAYEDFKQQFRNKPEFYEHIGPEDLPASLRIKLTDARYTEEVAARIQGAPGVDDVRFGGQIIKRLLQVNSLLRTITLVMSIVLMIASAGLIANTIRLAIYARREEIGIMKLVGATNWFIRIPFMLEGVLAAVFGALVAGGIVIATDALIFSKVGTVAQFLGPVFSFTSG